MNKKDEPAEIYIDGIVVVQPTSLSEIQTGDIVWYQIIRGGELHGPFLYKDGTLVNTNGVQIDMRHFNLVSKWFIQVPLTERHFKPVQV